MGRPVWALALASSAVLAGCGGAAEGAPTDASPEEFCAAIDWFVDEGLDRFKGGEPPPAADDMAELARDWSDRLVEVGTPENMSIDAREGFEAFVDRIDDLEGGDMGTFGWGEGTAWEGDAEKAFGDYVTNTC